MGLSIRARIALAALVASACVAAAPAQAGAANMEVAVQDDSVFLYHSYYDVSKAYRQAGALGMRYLRLNVLWGDFQRHGYALLDRAVNEALANGFKVQMTVAGTPQYDPKGNNYISFNRPNPTRYATFLRRIARHFKGRVFRWSIWNEPNLPRWISGPASAPKYYAALVRKGYPALKSVDRRNQVLIGELTSAHNPLTFLRQLGAYRVKADGLAYHPFQFGTEPGKPDRKFVGISNTPLIQSTLRGLARGRGLSTPHGGALPLYFTEFGYQGPGGGRYAMSEAKRVRWTLKAFQLVKRYGVKEMLYYQLVHSPPGTLRGDIWDSGIVNLSGSTTKVYKALLHARRTYTRSSAPRSRAPVRSAPRTDPIADRIY